MTLSRLHVGIVAYHRVSTTEQGVGGLGMEAQRRATEAFALSRSIPIVATYDEVETGTRRDLDNRPQLMAAIGHARRAKALLVIARLDRLARSVYATAKLMESRVDFVAVDNPHANRLTIHILAAMAEYEARLISERTKAGLEAARARGIKLGAPRNFTPAERRKAAIASAESHRRRAHEIYADLVPYVRELRTAGKHMVAIANALNAAGHRTQAGGKWTNSAVRRFLHREGMTSALPPAFRPGFRDDAHQQRAREASGDQSARRMAMVVAAAGFRAAKWYRDGLSLTEVARRLEADARPTPRGGRWSTRLVREVLASRHIAIRPRRAALARSW